MGAIIQYGVDLGDDKSNQLYKNINCIYHYRGKQFQIWFKRYKNHKCKDEGICLEDSYDKIYEDER